MFIAKPLHTYLKRTITFRLLKTLATFRKYEISSTIELDNFKILLGIPLDKYITILKNYYYYYINRIFNEICLNRKKINIQKSR